MPGFRHPPGADIERIRQDLRDRYQDGFPILKELLQNADDAGAGSQGEAATLCVFVMCPQGIPEAGHSLLRGPGLAILNDGGFTPEDANSITSLGLSSKAGQTAAAGKFGLGLKSVFHWAEAFFYFSPHSFTGELSTQSPGYDLLNPWSSRDTNTGRHREWDEEWQRTREADFRAFGSMVSTMLEAKRWFGLWIPLRNPDQTKDSEGTVKPIETRFPTPQFDELFGRDWRWRLAETLPLLRRVHAVRAYEHADGTIKVIAKIQTDEGAQRMGFGISTTSPGKGGSKHLSGKIWDADNSVIVGYAGEESYPLTPSLDLLRSNDAWPSQSALGPDGADLQVKAKAEPHGAVVFTRQAVVSQGGLHVQPAVFLPLGEPEQVACAGRSRFNLFLHGFFFVDSGRRRIQNDDELAAELSPAEAKSEQEVTGLWNRTLMREVVAPLVLPSLDAFVVQEQIKPAEVRSLVGGLQKSKILEELTQWTCRGQRFIHRLSPSGSQWVLEKSGEQDRKFGRWIELPAPAAPETELFRLLPALTDLISRVSVSAKGEPSLADHKPVSPSDEELAGLLGSGSFSAFHHLQDLSYLLKLIPGDASERVHDSPLVAVLIRLANQLVSQRLPEDKDLAQRWKEFFKRLPTSAIVRLPAESTAASAEITGILAGSNLPVALLWQDFCKAEGDGCIPWSTLIPVLRKLDGVAIRAVELTHQRSAIAVQLLEASDDKPKDWTEQIEDLSLFAVREQDKAVQAVSLAKLKAANSRGLLFTDGEAWAIDLTMAAPALKPLLVQPRIAEVLELPRSNCDATSCVSLLRNAACLAEHFPSRKRLFERLLKMSQPAEPEMWATLRCLLHGEIRSWQETATLFDETEAEPVLLRLLGKALPVANQPWRQIKSAVARELGLNAEERQHLNLVPVKDSTIEALIREVGPARVNCADLSTAECDMVLQRFEDLDVLRALNVHETVMSRRVCIGLHTYVDDGSFTDLPAEFDQLVNRLRPRSGYHRFVKPDESNKLVNALSWEAVIEIAIVQPAPDLWANAILAATGRRGPMRAEVRSRVRSIQWMPATSGSPVRPDDLLHIPGADAELNKLPTELLNGRVPLLRLHKEVQNHDRFETFNKVVLPAQEEAMNSLAALLQRDPAWSTGLSDDWTIEQVGHWVEMLGDTATALPIAAIVKAISSEAPFSPLLPGFLKATGGRLSDAAYAAILISLANRHESLDADARPRAEAVFLRYLKAIDSGGENFARRVLVGEGVRLLSAAGEWESPRRLAPTTRGLSDTCMIGEQCERALPLLMTEIRQFEMVEFEPHVPETPNAWLTIANQMRRLFEPWRQLLPSPEPIGAFLSLFNSLASMASLAEEFFRSQSLADVNAWLDQHYPGMREQLAQAFQKHAPNIQVLSAEITRTHSVLRTEFEARLERNPSALVLGGDPRVTRGSAMMVNGTLQPGRARRVLRLLTVDPMALPISDAVSMLQVATEQVIKQTLDRPVALGDLFDRLSKANQIEVQVAQSLVVEGALGLLRQIGGHAHPGISKALEMWDLARREEARAESLGNSDHQTAQISRRAAQESIRGLLASDSIAQTALLAEVRRKLQQYQYDASSVPFELWQNADDAVKELEQLTSDVAATVDVGFYVRVNARSISFIHFGRLINEFRLAGGASKEYLGFNRDLEKMVVQSISDKAEVGIRSGASLTGKFGLGFKSVFLVSDAPELVSGSVDFAIRGGVYPVRLEPSQRQEREEELRAFAPEHWRRATLVLLPLRVGVNICAHQVLNSFQRLAPLLVVFSRRLKRLRLRGSERGELEVSWDPQTFEEGINWGVLEGLECDIRSALVLSSNVDGDRFQFLLALGPDGFVSLPSDIPAFWVTAPTRATPKYGFAVNGPFEPDVGRVQLALQSEKNKQLAGDIAGTVASRLATVWKLAAGDWPSFREKLRLAAVTTPYAFWDSLWLLLGGQFVDKCRKDDEAPVATLARRILWACEADGLQSFYRNNAALPTGLIGDYRTLGRLPNLHHVAAGALDRKQVFEVVCGWPVFQQRVPVGSICSNRHVASILERLGVRPQAAASLHLAQAVEWELEQEHRADPELALRLGQIITPKFLRNLREGKQEERDVQEYEALGEVLGKVQIQAEDGSWHRPTDLVFAAGDGVETDEAMRAAFAPRECSLNPAYSGSALAFFLACRPQMEANAETMGKWVLKAGDEETRVAALQYLLKGALKNPLADYLRSQREGANWLWQLQASEWFKRRFPNGDDRKEILSHCLRLFEEQLSQLVQEQQGEENDEQENEVQPWTVRQLWLWWESQSKPIGDYTLEGEANWPLFRGASITTEEERKDELKRRLLSPDAPEGKALWYRLFGYACLVSAGRHTTELRRFWLQRLEPEGFWERTGEGDFSDRTLEIFERAVTNESTDMAGGGEQAYYWRRVFYDIRKVHRMVQNGFPATLLDLMDRGHGEHLLQFLRTGNLPNQRPWVGTFGQSTVTPLGFIIRELVRLEVITDEAVRPYAFYVCRPVLRALTKIGWIDEVDSGFSGQHWLTTLQGDPKHGLKLRSYYDIPLLHMGITHRGDEMPVPPE